MVQRINKVIIVFSNCGKTYYALKKGIEKNCIDHDCYYYIHSELFGNDWVYHYLQELKFLQEVFDIVFVNAIPEILEEISPGFLIVYPEDNLRAEYVVRAKNRSETEFYKLLDEKWDEWIQACKLYDTNNRRVLKSGEYLTNVI